MFVIMSSQKVKSRCQFLGFAKSVQKMNSINTTSGWSRMRRLQRVHQGNLVIGYKIVRRLYAISSIRCQFALDVQFFFRRVCGRGSSCDLSHRPDMSVIRWTVQSVDHQSVGLFVRPFRSSNWEVNEARYSVTTVARATEGPGYYSTSRFTEVDGQEVSMTVLIIY